MATHNMYVPIAIFLIIVLLSFLFFSGNKRSTNTERFYSVPQDSFPVSQPADKSVASSVIPNTDSVQSGIGDFSASDPSGDEAYNTVTGPPAGPVGSPSCFPRDRLTASDLLPKDAANSRWAQLNPAGQGDVSDQNFLTAGYHVGINTTGSSKKNSNLQLRSEPPNPQISVSPWMQSTITPSDVNNRLPLEIGGDY